jgi:hypothetical protein
LVPVPVLWVHGGLELPHLGQVEGAGELLVREPGDEGVVELLQREGGEVALRVPVPVDPIQRITDFLSFTFSQQGHSAVDPITLFRAYFCWVPCSFRYNEYPGISFLKEIT